MLKINVSTGLVIATCLLPYTATYPQSASDETFLLNLKNADIHSLIETVSRRTGRNFIIDPRVKATINVVSSTPIDDDKLYELFLSVLDVHGYAAVPAGQLIKIVPTAVGVQSAVPVLGKNNGNSDELVTQVVYLENAHAPQLIEILRPLIPQTASISAEENANVIVITDHAANIAKLIELIHKMDG